MNRRLARHPLISIFLCALVLVAPAPSGADAANQNAPLLLPNARHPMPGVLTGGQPSPEQLLAAGEAGYKTLINLRPAAEKGTKREDVAALGMVYVALPIAGAVDITEHNARVIAQALAAAERPAIVHCASGNRVGALFALKALYVDGKTPDEALAIGKAAGLTRLENTVKAHLEAAAAK